MCPVSAGCTTEGLRKTVPYHTDDHVIQEFDFYQLPRPDEVAGHLDVGLRWIKLRLLGRGQANSSNELGT